MIELSHKDFDKLQQSDSEYMLSLGWDTVLSGCEIPFYSV